MTQRILVAEDEMIVAFDLCDTVAEAGYEVRGPHKGVSAAMLDFQIEKPDLAILDVTLDDGIVFPLAEKLADEHVPIIFHSGSHTAKDIAARFPGAVAIEKPCPPADMINAVRQAMHPA